MTAKMFHRIFDRNGFMEPVNEAFACPRCDGAGEEGVFEAYSHTTQRIVTFLTVYSTSSGIYDTGQRTEEEREDFEEYVIPHEDFLTEGYCTNGMRNVDRL